jgi:hypothetical protein
MKTRPKSCRPPCHWRPESSLESTGVPASSNTIHETNPGSCVHRRAVKKQKRCAHTSQDRHCIIVSRSVWASYVLPHRQNTTLKFGPYRFSVFSASNVLWRVHAYESAVVGQSQRKCRLGNSSICSCSVWHAIEQAEHMPRVEEHVRHR